MAESSTQSVKAEATANPYAAVIALAVIGGIIFVVAKFTKVFDGVGEIFGAAGKGANTIVEKGGNALGTVGDVGDAIVTAGGDAADWALCKTTNKGPHCCDECFCQSGTSEKFSNTLCKAWGPALNSGPTAWKGCKCKCSGVYFPGHKKFC